MAKKNYTSKDYAQLLAWGLNAYMPTKTLFSAEDQHAHIFLNVESMGLGKESVMVRVSNGGALNVSGEILLQQGVDESIEAFKTINEFNRRAGITLYMDTKVCVPCLCARQELYMDHLTLAAAKRAAERVVLAVYDVRNALMMLANRLPEYFSEEALLLAKQAGERAIRKWQEAEHSPRLLTEEEMMEYLAALKEPAPMKWRDDEELPF